MDLELWKKVKKENKMTLMQISQLSGIPKRTVDDIFAGVTKNPRVDTMQAIEKALGIENEKNPPQLSDGEQKLLELFNQVPEEQKELVLNMINVALESLNNT